MRSSSEDTAVSENVSLAAVDTPRTQLMKDVRQKRLSYFCSSLYVYQSVAPMYYTLSVVRVVDIIVILLTYLLSCL